MIVALSRSARARHADLDPFPPHRVPPADVERGVATAPRVSRHRALQIKYGASVVKFMASGGVLSLGDPVDNPSSPRLRWTRSCRRRMPGAQGGGALPRRRSGQAAIQAGVDSIEHGTFLKPETLSLMQRKGVFLVRARVQPAGPRRRRSSRRRSSRSARGHEGLARDDPERAEGRRPHRFRQRRRVGLHGKTNPEQLVWLVGWASHPLERCRARP